MKKTRFCFALALLVLSIGTLGARDIRDLWIEMPDSLTAYLDKDMRRKMADLALLDASLSTENSMKGLSRIDSISANYLSARMSDARRIEMAIATRPLGDSCIVVLSTCAAGDMSETDVSLYDFAWNLLGSCSLSPELCIKEDVADTAESGLLMATVAARFCDAYTVELIPSTFPKKESEKFTQKKVKIYDLPFK